MMRIEIDEDRCTGHGRCYDLASELVVADDDGRGAVVADAVPAGLEAQARAAQMSCPERAITLTG